MIKAIAIDDEPISLKVIENFCREIDFITLDKTFEDPKAGLKYLNKFPVDLLFLDIDMPLINGIELYKSLKQDTMVIFITTREDCAIEGFNLMAADYLLKPFTFERFKQAVKRANDFFNLNTQSTQPEDNKYLFLRADLSLVKVDIAKIIYIEALDDYLKIYIEDQKTLVVRMTMKVILEKLPANQFVRTHRSFIVPVNRILELRSKSVLLDKLEVPVSNNFMKEVVAVFRK
jgi:DNA-binding LytR/AlgR family response regulator